MIWRLQLRAGGGHSDPELAVRVLQGALPSGACSWGPVGNTLILSLLFGSGKQAGAGPLSTLASGGGVFDRFRSSARRPELGDKPSPVPGVVHEREKEKERERR